MQVLLDTNCFVRLNQSYGLIKPSITQDIQNSDMVFVSSVAFLEIAIKKQKYPESFAYDSKEFLRLAKSDSYTILDVSADIAPVLERLPLHHKDPFDRIMIAQAMHHDLTIVSSDEKFKLYDIDLIEA